MASLQCSKSGTWYAIFSEHGRKHWIRIGKGFDRPQAKKILKELEIEHARDRLNLPSERAIPFCEYIPKYLDYSKANKSPETHRRERWTVNKLNNYFGKIPLPKITTQIVDSYKVKRLEMKLSKKTINRELEILRAMLNKALEWNYIEHCPKVKLFKLHKQPPRILSLDEIQRLLDNANAYLKPMITIQLNLGMRIGELLNLKFEDINFIEKNLLVHARKTLDYRVVPLSPEAYETLMWLKDNYVNPKTLEITPRQHHQRKYVFCNPDGGKVNTIRTSFNKCRQKAGVQATPTYLRHCFASYLIMSGVDVVTVKELLGHKSVETTMIYTHISTQHKVKAINQLPWANGKKKTDE